MMVMVMILSAVLAAALLLRSKAPREDIRSLEDLLPLWKVENDCILAKNGDVTVAFRVRLPEIFTLSNDEYEALHHTCLKALKILPPGTILHKQDWFIRPSR